MDLGLGLVLILFIFGAIAVIFAVFYFLAKYRTLISGKICPYCAEKIKAEAKVCRYCHRDVAIG